MKKIYTLLFPLAMVTSALAQDEGFIYGRVTTSDGKKYEGPLRWGKEEVYWVDVFNASKKENDNIKYLSSSDIQALDDKRMWEHGDFISSSTLRWLGIRNRSSYREGNDFIHQFSCQFGDIKSLTPRWSDDVEVELRNGMKVLCDGDGYNDVGASIRVLDAELGEVQLKWDRVEKVEFMRTPARLPLKFGEPLYGTVESYNGDFTGYIQWDHDERLGIDKLDGDTQDGDVSIAFDKIKSIERRMSRSYVVLKSGRELELRGSNDVNDSNRGIIIADGTGCIIDVPWDEFRKVTFTAAPAKDVTRYDDFKSPKEINATVLTASGSSLQGRTVLDLDEQFDFELFQGKEGEVEFSIPVRNIQKIAVIHGHKAELYLRNGKKLILDESQDVGELNQGVLVFNGGKDPAYIPWEEVREIQFDR